MIVIMIPITIVGLCGRVRVSIRAGLLHALAVQRCDEFGSNMKLANAAAV